MYKWVFSNSFSLLQCYKTVPAHTTTFPYADDVSTANLSSYTSCPGPPTHSPDFKQPSPVAVRVTYVPLQPRMGPRHFNTTLGHRFTHEGRGTRLPNSNANVSSNANVLSRGSYHNYQPSRPHSNVGIRLQTNLSEKHQKFMAPGQFHLNLRPGQMLQSTGVMSFGNVEALNTNLPVDLNLQNVTYSADPNVLMPGIQAPNVPSLLQQTYQEQNQLQTDIQGPQTEQVQIQTSLQGLQTDQSFIQFKNFAHNQNQPYQQNVVQTGGQNMLTSAQKTDVLQTQFQTEVTNSTETSGSASDARPSKGVKKSKVGRKRKSAMLVDTRLFKTKPGRKRPKSKQHILKSQQDNQCSEEDGLEDNENLQKERLKLEADTFRTVTRSKKKIKFGQNKEVKQRNQRPAVLDTQTAADVPGSEDPEKEESTACPEKQMASNTEEIILEKSNCHQRRKHHMGRSVPKAKGQAIRRTGIHSGVTTSRLKKKVKSNFCY